VYNTPVETKYYHLRDQITVREVEDAVLLTVLLLLQSLRPY
jgi:hypothetical protein